MGSWCPVLLGKRLEGLVGVAGKERERKREGKRGENILLRLRLSPPRRSCSHNGVCFLCPLIPSHEGLSVSTWLVDPGVPGRLLCRSPAIPTRATGPRHWAGLDPCSNSSLPVRGYFPDTVQDLQSAPSPRRSAAPHALQVRCAYLRGTLFK